MLDAIEEVHNMGYIHRDIKPVRQLNLKFLGKFLSGKRVDEKQSIHC
jgi:hypothetical protein